MGRPPKELIYKGKLSLEQAFGLAVRERRMELGMLQSEFEDADGMDRSYISKIELGKNQINLKGILFLAKKLEGCEKIGPVLS